METNEVAEQLSAQFDALVAEHGAVEGTGPAATKTRLELAARIEEIRVAHAEALTPVEPVEEIAPLAEVVTPDAVISPEGVVTPVDAPAPVEAGDRELMLAAEAGHAGGAPAPSAPVTTATVMPLIRASTGESIVDPSVLANDYKSALSSTSSGKVEIWRASRRHSGLPEMTQDMTQTEMARVVGILPDATVSRAECDPCNELARTIEAPSCTSNETFLNAWMPKVQMDDFCEFKVKLPTQPVAPDFFEWAYSECDDEGKEHTGLVVDGAIVDYDPKNEDTWKPVTGTDVAKSKATVVKLRSQGYIRKFERGQDLCDPAGLVRATQEDTALFEKAKDVAVLNAFSTYANAFGHAFTFDGTAYANPQAALVDMLAEILPSAGQNFGVNFADATLILPSACLKKFAVTRFESVSDNLAASTESILADCGLGSIVSTDCTLGEPDKYLGSPGEAVAIVPECEKTFDIFVAFRESWRQGQGPGARGVVAGSDEKNLRGNCRLAMVEDDLVNFPIGCLSAMQITATLKFNGGHVLGSDPRC